MKLKALKMFDLKGNTIKPEDEFETSEHISRDLIALKMAISLEPEKWANAQDVDITEYVSKVEHEALFAAFESFKNDPEAMKARLAELEQAHTPDIPPQELDPLKMSNDEIKALLTEKGIEFKQNAKKDELLSLIPKE